MKVLVTGNQGYIGSVMQEVLTALGYKVIGLDAGYFAGASFVSAPADAPTLRKDLRDVEVGDLSGIDAIVHLAALSNDPLGELDPALTFAINSQASIDLARRAREAGVSRFLYSSSCSLYGKGSGEFLTEEDGFNPQTPYAKSKIMAEQGIAELADDRFSPVFLRNSTVYGVSARQRFDLVVPNLAGWAFTTGKVNILSDGTPWRPLVHVRDAVEAFRAALEAPRESVHNQAFNVGRTGENYQVRDIADLIREALPGSEVTYGNPHAGGDTRDYKVSFEKIETRLPGFSPSWRLPGGISECLDAYRNVGLTFDQFTSRHYTRLKQLKHLRDETGLIDATLRWSTKA